MPHNKDIGQLGETLAVKYLKKKGYKIIENNFRTKLGEIDIVAKDGKYIVFIEVKTRKSIKYGYPREAVGLYKQSRIKSIASLYLAKNKILDNFVRFDVVEIILDNNEETGSIVVLKDAFQ